MQTAFSEFGERFARRANGFLELIRTIARVVGQFEFVPEMPKDRRFAQSAAACAMLGQVGADKTVSMAFGPAEAARLAGLSARQAADWADLVGPSWNGLYSFRDLVALRTVRRLQESYGIPTTGLRRATKFMRAHADEPWSGLRIGVGPKNKLYFKTAAGWLSADGAEQRIAEVALDHVAEELKSAVTKARSRPAEFEGQFERSRSVGGNQARFKGTRIAVNVVIEMLRQGMSATAILQEMPTLKRKDIGAAKEVLLGDRKLPAA